MIRTIPFWRRSSLILLLLLAANMGRIAYAQNLEQPIVPATAAPEGSLAAYEDTMLRFAEGVRSAPMPDERAAFCYKLAGTMSRALAQSGSYTYPFQRLAEHIHVLSAPDGAFRIFNWVVSVSNFQRQYYAVLQTANGSTYPLYDRSDSLEKANAQQAQTTAKAWYGVEIYNILAHTVGNEQVYSIFGYNSNAYYSKRKLIDIMVLTPDGPRFALPIIHTPQGALGRFILEYKNEAYVNLNYNKDEKKVIFDQLASEVGDPNKKYTYVPVGQMDGFQWQNDHWQFIENPLPILKLKDGQAPIDGVIPNR